MANIDAQIQEFSTGIINGKIAIWGSLREAGCHAFMRYVQEDKYISILFSSNKIGEDSAYDVALKPEIIEFWLEKIKPYIEDVEYWGIEDIGKWGKRHAFLYKPKDIKNGILSKYTMNLLRHTLFRQIFTYPYNFVVLNMFYLENNHKEFVEKYGFWKLFFIYSLFLIYNDGYDSEYGFYSENLCFCNKNSKLLIPNNNTMGIIFSGTNLRKLDRPNRYDHINNFFSCIDKKAKFIEYPLEYYNTIKIVDHIKRIKVFIYSERNWVKGKEKLFKKVKSFLNKMENGEFDI